MIADGGQEVRRSGNLEGKKIGSLEGKSFTLNSLSSNPPTLLSSSNHSGGNASLIPPYGLKKKPAFTLAEVLITLGIIGIVAALTLPTLISNHNKRVWATQLERDVNYIQNNLRKIMADEEVDDLFNTSVVYTSAGGDYLEYRFAENKLSDYLNLKQVSDNSKFKSFINSSLYGGSDYKGFNLNDGSCIAFDDEGGNIVYVGQGSFEDHVDFGFLIDVNCDRAPNKGGRDRFKISINNQAKIVFPYSLNKDSVLSFCESQSLGDDFSGLDDETAGLLIDGQALFCSYKIMNDGWKMNY